MTKKKPTFGDLVKSIAQIHEQMAGQATRAVNISLTLRNWLIGMHVAEYELRGSDRAIYGEGMMSKLAEQLQKQRVSNCNRRELYRYAQFYRVYPQIVGTLPPQFKSLTPKKKIVGTLSPQSRLTPEKLLHHLSYSHFELLLDIDDFLKRHFYEIECIRGNWSVRELKRQIATLYFERAGLSKNKKKLAALTHKKAISNSPQLTVRDPYIFEFIGLKSKEVMGESHLEDALLDKLQNFILELGHGFCFEARQKRLMIGGEYFFADLIFYHRILKCHVLIELKIDEFKHEHLGQLNTYVGYYRQHEMSEGDNPPIGILLCTKKNHALVEFALAGITNKLFVSKYQTELPKKKEIQNFLEEQLEAVKQK